MRTISQFINGQSVARTGAVTSPVYDPSTGQVQARLEHGDAAILAEVVAVAKAAQPAWAAINPQRRARVMFKFKALIEEHRQELVHLMSSEHGKLLDDSNGELQRGLDVVEFVCGVPHLQKGEFTQGAGPGINVYSIREPLGVVAGITPFNFPAMIPLWMLAPAIAVGNAFILNRRSAPLPLPLGSRNSPSKRACRRGSSTSCMVARMSVKRSLIIRTSRP